MAGASNMEIRMNHLWVFFLACLILVTLEPSIFAKFETQELLLKVAILVIAIGGMYQFRTWSMGRYLPWKKPWNS